MKSPKFMGIVLVLALLTASSAHAERKKGRRAKSSSTDSSSSVSMMAIAPPSSLLAPPSPPVDSTPPPPTDSAPKVTPLETATPASAESPPEADADHPRIALMPLVLLGVEPLYEGRVFRQSTNSPPSQQRYNAIGYPSVALTGELFPFANVKSKFLRGFGLTGHFARAFGFESANPDLGGAADPNAAPVNASFMRYAGGLRYRIHTNPESETPFVFGISASLCRWYYSFASEVAGGPDVEVPTANYRMARLGVDGGVAVKRVTFYGYLNYLHAFSVVPPSTRQLDTAANSYLPGAVGMGGEFRGAVGVRVVRWLEVRLSLEYAIMAFNVKPLEGLAGEPALVLDSYLSAGLGPYVSF